MKKAILGKKIGMTQIFDETGLAIPVTVIEAGPCVVSQIKTIDKDGYNAVQVGFVDVKEKLLNKPKIGHFTKSKLALKRYLAELRLEDISTYNVGDEIKADTFAEGEIVDAQGISKGKGYQGSIKRHGFSRGPMSHGSMYHRRSGSMGATSTPGRVFKGKKLPGRMGGKTVTIQNLKIVKVDVARNLILIKGSMPGAKNSIIKIKSAIKA